MEKGLLDDSPLPGGNISVKGLLDDSPLLGGNISVEKGLSRILQLAHVGKSEGSNR